jgi:flavin-dependent dehydrogenase
MSDPMILVDRATFDHALVKEAMGRPGAKIDLRDGWAVEDASEDLEGVTLRSTGGARIRCRYVIAADGATSRVARSIGLYNKAQGAGVDAHVRVTHETFVKESQRVTFNLHCVEAGYGWVFPKGDHLSCGVGMWRNPKRLLPQLETFLNRTLPEGSILDIERLSHPVPVFQGHKTIASRRVCLVGDAAHMVDPVLGEGIKYALEAGQLAARVIMHLCNPDGTGPDIETGTRDLDDLLRQYGDCRVYNEIARYTVCRKLNVIRLTEDGFFTNPEGVYQAVVA